MNSRTAKNDLLKKMQSYLAEIPEPAYASNMDLLEDRSWRRSTVSFLMEKVTESDMDPALIISEFIKKVDRRSGLSFRVAYETAVDLYDNLFL